jgi:hypothetical protein
MLTVHKMPLKNQFFTGIICDFDKTPNQNATQPFPTLGFTGDWPFDSLGKENCRRMTSTLSGTGIIYNTMMKPDAEMIPCFRDFYPNRVGNNIFLMK